MASPPGLEPDEQLLARAPASFRGAAAATIRTTFALSAARRRLDAYHQWQDVADLTGFTTMSPEMVLGVTEKTLLVWRTRFWSGRPRDITARVALSTIHDVAIARHAMVTGLAIVFRNGAIVEVEAMRGRRLRRLGAELQRLLAEPGDRFRA